MSEFAVYLAVMLILAFVMAMWALALVPKAKAKPPVVTDQPLTASKPPTLAERRQSRNAADELLAKFQSEDRAYTAGFRGAPEGSSVLRGYRPRYGEGDAGRL